MMAHISLRVCGDFQSYDATWETRWRTPRRLAAQCRLEPFFHQLLAHPVQTLVSRASMIRMSLQPSPSSEYHRRFDRRGPWAGVHGTIVHHPRKTTLSMWVAIKQLTDVRNLMVHGVWAMLDNTIAVRVSKRLASEPGHVEGEGFTLERLQAFVRQCLRVKNELDRLSDQVRAEQSDKSTPRASP